MRKVVFMIDGWFMRKRIYTLKAFHYDGPSIREYCLNHLRDTDSLYRIFYYDTNPLEMKGHHPVTGKHVDFARTDVAKHQRNLLESLKKRRTLLCGWDGLFGETATGYSHQKRRSCC